MKHLKLIPRTPPRRSFSNPTGPERREAYLAYSQLTYLDFESLDALFLGLPVDAGPSPAKGGERAGRRTVDASTTKGSSG